LPECLTRAFVEDPLKVQQWLAFLDSAEAKPGPLTNVVDDEGNHLALGRANRRMKDLSDRRFSRRHSGTISWRARSRRRSSGAVPRLRKNCLIGTRAFVEDPRMVQQWSAFLDCVETKPDPLPKVVDDLAAFLMPRARARKLQDRFPALERGGSAIRSSDTGDRRAQLHESSECHAVWFP
jgi:hypothetical protein